MFKNFSRTPSRQISNDRVELNCNVFHLCAWILDWSHRMSWFYCIYLSTYVHESIICIYLLQVVLFGFLYVNLLLFNINSGCFSYFFKTIKYFSSIAYLGWDRWRCFTICCYWSHCQACKHPNTYLVQYDVLLICIFLLTFLLFQSAHWLLSVLL